MARVRAGECHDARQLRRTVAAVTRYLLRMTGRSTPFALFAGATPATLGPAPDVRWTGRHHTVVRADGVWLDAVIAALEQYPALLRRLPVVLNNLADVDEHRLVVTCQRPPIGDERRGVAPAAVDVSIRRTAVVSAVAAYARGPIAVGDLLAKLHIDFPHGSTAAAEATIAQLVRTRVLLTALRPPMTATEGLAHLIAQLAAIAEAIPELADTVRTLRAIHGRMRHHEPGERESLIKRMSAVHTAAGQPLAVDLRLDAVVTLPDTLLRHAVDAAAVLTRLTPYPAGLPAWEEYHAAFLERYGVGAIVPLLDVVNPDVGLGLPATFRGSDRTVATSPLSERDLALLRLATRGGAEVVLDDRTIADLACRTDLPMQAPPHVELFLQIHAENLEALRQNQYTLVVSGAARAAGATAGRFLHLLDTADQDRFRAAYSSVATVRAGAVPVHVSFPPVRASSDHLACAPRMLPTTLSVGEFGDGHAAVGFEDLAVSGDLDGLFFVSLRDGRLVEPTILNAVEFRTFSHPLARFLCELPRARNAVYMPFSWGAASSLPFLPRLRYGRTILAPARWNLAADELPNADAPFPQWREALAEWQQQFRLPDRVYLVESDNLLPLDLTEALHLDLLRTHLDRHRHARLDEAPPRHAYGWLDDHAHEITIPLTSTEPAIAAPPTAHVRPTSRDDGRLPGAAPWLYAKLYTSPGRILDVLEEMPDLLASWADPADWWYLPYRDPDPHLRLRIRLCDVDAYGPATARVGAWAARLRRQRLVGRLQLDTYQPETGRYGYDDAMAAAERVFTSDSAAAVAELRAAAEVPLDALGTASLVDIAVSFVGHVAAGMWWLTTYLPNETTPTTRALHTAAVHLADPSNGWAVLREIDNGATVLDAWRQRRAALTTYRDHLASQRDPLSVLPSLLHLHSVRLHGIDPDRERLGRRLTRAAALRWTALHKSRTR